MFTFFQKKQYLVDEFPENFIDIHCHLLPGIDDGAKTIEDSLELIHHYQQMGIHHFIGTPHIMDEVWENTPETIGNSLTVLKEKINDETISENICAAAEYMLDANFEKLLADDKPLLTLKDTMVLVEMSYVNPPINLQEILFQLQVKGYQPILAHPERYGFYHNTYDMYDTLKTWGCKFQLNLLSLSDHYGTSVQKIAIKLLKDKAIDFIGTDTHNLYHIEKLKRISDKKVVQLVTPILQENALFLP